LDDEKHILSDLLEKAKKKLGDDREPASIVHSYGSLEILTQSAFVLSRPNSRLTKEYDALRSCIISKNFTDREGALVALSRMPGLLEWARKNGRQDIRGEVRKDTIDIRRHHVRNGEIAFLAARVFSDLGEQDQELEALTTAVEFGSEINQAHLARAGLHLMARRNDEARADLLEVLSSQVATVFELAPALQLAARLESYWLDAVDKALDRPDSEFKTLVTLSTFIMTQRNALPALARRMMQSIGSAQLSDMQRQRARNYAVLSLIGSGAFARALEVLKSPETGTLEDQFNMAIAQWGLSKAIPRSAFEEIAKRLAKETPSPGANFHQCYALALGVLGQSEAAEREIESAKAQISAGGIDFSCWQYLNVSGDGMVDDLTDMRAQIDKGSALQPPFLQIVPDTVH